jgi:lipoprotein-anchoring transpeptidase ErfK/SrfK
LWAGAHADPSADAASNANDDSSAREPETRDHRARGHANARVVEPSSPAREDGSTPVAESPHDAGSTIATADAAVAPQGPFMTALWIWVPIFERMDTHGPKLGYLRAGARVAVSATPQGVEGCSRGWYAVATGGYLCLNNLTSLDENALGRRRPSQPDLTAPLPYTYLTTHRAAVMYRWLPSVADMREIEPERFGVTPPNATASLDGGVPPTASSTTVTSAETPAVLSTTAPVTAGSTADTPTPTAIVDAGVPVRNLAAVQTRAQAEDAGVRLEDLAGQAGSPLLRRMLSGMYISIDRDATSAGRHFWRTQNGGFVERNAVSDLHDAPTFQGVTLDQQHQLPVAFMTAYNGWTYALGTDGHTVSRQAQAPRLTAYFLTEDPPITFRDRQYYRTRDGILLSARQIRLSRTTPPPADLLPDEKWIEVNLDRQMLVAYVGARPVYITLVSSGRRNEDDEERNYETVQGGFRIQSKHIATTMDGNTAGDGPYSIEDVPWVMYFQNSFALHGAFWHSAFGAMHSHGCVNMSPPDAHWMFQWTEPALPAGWHGVYSDAQHPGTRVYVHYEDQALGEHGGPDIIPQH